MIHLIEQLQQELDKEAPDGKNFIKSLDHYFEELYQLTTEQSGLLDRSSFELNELLQLSFACRLQLCNKLDGWAGDDKKINDDLLANVYDMNRALRYLEDYVLEIAMSNDLSQQQVYDPLQGTGLHFIVAPGEQFNGPKDLRSGDVILSRGSAFTSAAIARIGVNDTQFSHLSFAYRNPQEDNKLYTIEAHIEIGSVVAPIELHLQQKNSRSVVYRFENSQLAHQAAAYMFHKVKKQSEAGKNIDYNFSMQYEDTNTLFCSQVIYDGFFQASSQKVDVPKFKTQFNVGLIPFLNRMGIPASPENIDQMKTFSPGDIEYDNRFRLIAEWKDTQQIRDTRLKDAVLTKLFAWMNKEQYHIHPPLSIHLKSRLTWLLRRTPIIKNWMLEKLPLNMTIGQLNVFLTLDKIGAILQKEVTKAQSSAPHPMSMREIFEVLEQFKIREAENKQSAFHHWFHVRE